MTTTGWREARVDKLAAGLPRQAWKRLSGGPGSHGERVYGWARAAIRPVWEDGAGHWALARRSVKDPTDIAHYVCYGPAATRLKDLVKVAAARWAIEVAKLVAAHEDAVRDVIHRFNENGLVRLDPRWAGGRPRQLTP